MQLPKHGSSRFTEDENNELRQDRNLAINAPQHAGRFTASYMSKDDSGPKISPLDAANICDSCMLAARLRLYVANQLFNLTIGTERIGWDWLEGLMNLPHSPCLITA